MWAETGKMNPLASHSLRRRADMKESRVQEWQAGATRRGEAQAEGEEEQSEAALSDTAGPWRAWGGQAEEFVYRLKLLGNPGEV